MADAACCSNCRFWSETLYDEDNDTSECLIRARGNKVTSSSYWCSKHGRKLLSLNQSTGELNS